MTFPNLESTCLAKENELIDKYFKNHATRIIDPSSEKISDDILNLPSRIEREYREYLEGLWNQYTSAPLILEEQTLRSEITEDDREAITHAYADAKRITLWEKFTGTNHHDVARLRGLILDYTKELLMVMRIDFLEEITGRHITCKSFSEY